MALGSFALLWGTVGLVVLVIAMQAISRKSRKQQTLTAGLPTDGQVLHTYTVPGDQGRNGVQHAVVAFRTADGRRFLINDESGLPRAVGDRVPVRYLSEEPQGAVLADVPQGVVGAVLLGFCAVGLAAGCLSAALLVLAHAL